MQVTSLTVIMRETVDVAELESEIVTAVADRLRDDHGYELVAAAGAGGPGTGNEHPWHPAGSIVVAREPGALKVRLHGVQVDAPDLVTGVSSELQQRHEGLRVEIG
jgi:hypothetical protein